jgi:hypothetical protein
MGKTRNSGFGELYAELRMIMVDNANAMIVAKDAPGELEMHAPWPNPRKPAERMWFGAVKISKSYVSYHLMPLYLQDDLLSSASEALRKRMQGKTCFNFRMIDKALFADLAQLTHRAAVRFASPKTMSG